MNLNKKINNITHFVDDVVDALIASASTDTCYGRVFNLGGSEVISLKDLAQKLSELQPDSSWRLVPFPEERKKIDIGDYYSNYELASDLLGWSPQVKLDEGLLKTVHYYRQNLSEYL